ncbi:hypothetical protein [Streptomyces rubellomurinus]|uniref:Uncharacterized protein n=2 Tax=Streptomyces TaxID=1883 RepID=A0A0F2TBE4_STRR3|nr:hypothetical protein [Streptomyces rubellomurinus]KJS52866.1 hypothetical protein VM98_28680 [Streptomyces rubellomurinus subsp. indigoferus]KJS59811.1 hypothetical protein VM95_24860 [Streptomyces rubellomurinus]
MSRAQRRALTASLLLAVAFTVFAYVTTQAKGLRAASPWQADPYDAVVSFTLFLVPALAAAATARSWLCRGAAPQPGHRVDQLLRAARLGVLLVAATAATDWAAVALRAERERWGAPTVWLIAALVPLTAGAARCLRLLRRATREPAPAPPPEERRRPGGDWLDDLVLLAAPIADLTTAAALLRRHLVAAAAGLSLLAAAGLVAGQAIGEGRPGPLVALVELSVFTCGFFAFCLLGDAVLRIAATGSPWSPARAAAFAAALAVPVSGSLRSALWHLAGLPGTADSPGRLLALMAGCALLAATATLTAARARHLP